MGSASTLSQKILYPNPNDTVLDKVCLEIIKKAEERDWRVEGLNFEFGLLDTPDQQCFVYKIWGEGFVLVFEEGLKFTEIKNVSLSKASIPRQVIVLGNHQGHYKYRGGDWERDKDGEDSPVQGNNRYGLQKWSLQQLWSRHAKSKNKTVILQEFERWLTSNVLTPMLQMSLVLE